jgi:hypothetical protein
MWQRSAEVYIIAEDVGPFAGDELIIGTSRVGEYIGGF